MVTTATTKRLHTSNKRRAMVILYVSIDGRTGGAACRSDVAVFWESKIVLEKAQGLWESRAVGQNNHGKRGVFFFE
jgi:hypothetical protein